MTIWLVCCFSGGTPGESTVSVFTDEVEARRDFDALVKQVKEAFPNAEVMEDEKDTFYYDAGDTWEYITIDERQIGGKL